MPANPISSQQGREIQPLSGNRGRVVAGILGTRALKQTLVVLESSATLLERRVEAAQLEPNTRAIQACQVVQAIRKEFTASFSAVACGAP